MPRQKREHEYYPLMQECLMAKFLDKFDNCCLEITADGRFSEILKSKIPRGREIIFSFLRRGLSPDLTGFIEQKYSNDFITVEIKNGKIRLQDIYQAKMYADLFYSKYAFLLSKTPIPYEIINLSKTAVFDLLSTAPRGVRLAQFSIYRRKPVNTEKLVCTILPHTWLPENPFGDSVEPKDVI